MWLNLLELLQMNRISHKWWMWLLRLCHKKIVTFFLPLFLSDLSLWGKPAAIFLVALRRGPCGKGLMPLANSWEGFEALPLAIQVSLEADPAQIKPSGDCNPGRHLDCSLVRDLRRGHQLSHHQISDPPKLWDKKYLLFEVAKFWGDCYGAVDE